MASDTSAVIKGLQEELLETRAELDRRYKDLQRIHNIVNSIHSTLDLGELQNTAKGLLETSLGLDSYFFMAYDHVKRHFVGTRAKGFPVALKQQAVQAGRKLKPDATEHAPVPIRAQQAGRAVSAVMMPLYAQNRIVGALCAPRGAVARLSPYDREILSLVTTELAVAIDNSMLYEITKKLAITDDQTKLFNRRYMLGRLDFELQRADRFAHPCSFLMLDVDDFKQYNDRFGHLSGDVALSEMARIVKKECRAIDIPARYGGEEFSVILPNTSNGGAKVLARRILKAMSAHKFYGGKRRRTEALSLSIGVATFPQHARTCKSLIAAADQALYVAKQRGKNCCAVATCESDAH